jgi:7-cyano-7-deazaguanine synthase
MPAASEPARKAVVLLSGGLDSSTAAAMARADGFELYALTVAYGQRHAAELDAACRVAAALGVARHVVLDLDLSAFGGSSLTGDGAVPKDRAVGEPGIPSTYVPARNTVFLSLALAWAEALGASDIVIGVNAVDYSGYPDCRPAFIEAFERTAALATRAGVEGARFRIHAPLIGLTKGEIIRRGLALGLDYGLTHSCYDPAPGGRPCGRCDSCTIRARGFAEVGVEDPGSKDPGLHGPKDPGLHGPEDPGLHGSTDPGLHGPNDPRLHGSDDSGHHGSNNSGLHGSNDPGLHEPRDRPLGDRNPDLHQSGSIGLPGAAGGSREQ